LPRCCRIDGYDSTAGRGEQECQASCPAADIEHKVCAEFVDDVEVDRQVVAVPIEGVIDTCEATVGEDRINHAATVAAFGCSGDRSTEDSGQIRGLESQVRAVA
jgi:hypothetical protein